MRMSTKHSADLSVHEVTHSFFFARCLGMEINKNNLCLFAELLYLTLCRIKRRITWLHICSADYVDNSDLNAVICGNNHRASARAVFAEVCGTYNVILLFENNSRLLCIPCMIAHGKALHTGSGHFVISAVGYTSAVTGVFSVCNNQVDIFLIFQILRIPKEHISADTSHNITDTKYSHNNLRFTIKYKKRSVTERVEAETEAICTLPLSQNNHN